MQAPRPPGLPDNGVLCDIDILLHKRRQYSWSIRPEIRSEHTGDFLLPRNNNNILLGILYSGLETDWRYSACVFSRIRFRPLLAFDGAVVVESNKKPIRIFLNTQHSILKWVEITTDIKLHKFYFWGNV